MTLARHAHHMKTIFTCKDVLPDFLSMLSFGKQQKHTTHFLHVKQEEFN